MASACSADKRRQRHSTLLDHLDECAADREEDERPEDRIAHDSQGQLDVPAELRLHGHIGPKSAGEIGVRARRPAPARRGRAARRRRQPCARYPTAAVFSTTG